MTNIYELSARGREYPVGFHQSDYEYSGPHYVIGDTPEEARKALEAYLGKGWTASEKPREVKSLNKLPLEQKLDVLAELLRADVIGKDGKIMERYTAAAMEKTLGPLADRVYKVLACSHEEAANWFYCHKIRCYDGNYTPAELYAHDKNSLEIILTVLKDGVS